jgi:hypothetical protein
MKPLAIPPANSAMAIFPSVVGFGWIVFDGPLSPYRWQVSTVAARERTSAEKNARCLKRIEQLLREHRPSVLVLEQFEGGSSRRWNRIQALCRAIISLAAVEGIPVRVLTREEIARCFPNLPMHTRESTAERTALCLKEIRARLPAKRKIWEGENANAALMNAAALLIAHYCIPVSGS